MFVLLSSAEFWIGALTVISYQYAKFSELSTLDPEIRRQLVAIPKLRPGDFAARGQYRLAFVVYIIVSFFVYLGLCLAPTAITKGLSNIFAVDIEGNGNAAYGPIAIAAFYMALTQSVVPGLGAIGEWQKQVFHLWLGIPNRVVEASDYLANQLISRCHNERELRSLVKYLRDPEFIQRIDRFADVIFYKNRILDTFSESVSTGAGEGNMSGTRSKSVISNLLLYVCMSVVRESGGRGLVNLWQMFDVEAPPSPVRNRIKGPIATFAMVSLVSIILLSVILPGLYPIVDALTPNSYRTWPSGPQWVITAALMHMIPTMAAVAITVAIYFKRGDEHPDRRAYRAPFISRFSVGVIVIVISVILYDYVRTFIELGSTDSHPKNASDALNFLSARLQIFALHGLSVACAAGAALRMIESASLEHLKTDILPIFLSATLLIIVFSASYGIIQSLRFPDQAYDLIVLAVTLNCFGLWLSMYATYSLLVDRLETQDITHVDDARHPGAI